MSLGVVPVVLLASGASGGGAPPVARVSACASSRSTSVSFFSRLPAMSAPYPRPQSASPRSPVGAKVGYRFAGRAGDNEAEAGSGDSGRGGDHGFGAAAGSGGRRHDQAAGSRGLSLGAPHSHRWPRRPPRFHTGRDRGPAD